MAEFVTVAQVGDLPDGQMIAVQLGSEQVVLANVGGTYCAFERECPHRAGPLDMGELEGDVVTCPLHGSEFNVRTGEVLSPPAREGIRTFPVRVEGAAIQVAGD